MLLLRGPLRRSRLGDLRHGLSRGGTRRAGPGAGQLRRARGGPCCVAAKLLHALDPVVKCCELGNGFRLQDISMLSAYLVLTLRDVEQRLLCRLGCLDLQLVHFPSQCSQPLCSLVSSTLHVTRSGCCLCREEDSRVRGVPDRGLPALLQLAPQLLHGLQLLRCSGANSISLAVQFLLLRAAGFAGVGLRLGLRSLRRVHCEHAAGRAALCDIAALGPQS
mmetsp:Transcript_103231/g.321693  ORF Transcript_103231/g.321693 Transcript_103231/m.321693 type:complete len:220 (+) Transcript_103231:529-1188(+)